tara:strand:- start:238 stop:690 length:453 start_codon:yes stop_codon:yes gene_type:complete
LIRKVPNKLGGVILAKQSPVPDELSKPFWDAANEEKLVIQNCKSCERLHHPPKPECDLCGSGSHMEWKEMSGRGTIYNYGVVFDCPIRTLQEDQPFNVAVVMLEEDSGIQMYSHLPGIVVDDVPVGAAVEIIFETTGSGQKVPEWQISEK